MHLFKIRSKIKIGIYAFSLFNFWHFAKQKRRQKGENLMKVAFGKKILQIATIITKHNMSL